MKVIIKETGEAEELEYYNVDIVNGKPILGDIDFAVSEVMHKEPNIEKDQEGNVIMTREQFAWWTEYLMKEQMSEWRIAIIHMQYDDPKTRMRKALDLVNDKNYKDLAAYGLPPTLACKINGTKFVTDKEGTKKYEFLYKIDVSDSEEYCKAVLNALLPRKIIYELDTDGIIKVFEERN